MSLDAAALQALVNRCLNLQNCCFGIQRSAQLTALSALSALTKLCIVVSMAHSKSVTGLAVLTGLRCLSLDSHRSVSKVHLLHLTSLSKLTCLEVEDKAPRWRRFEAQNEVRTSHGAMVSDAHRQQLALVLLLLAAS